MRRSVIRQITVHLEEDDVRNAILTLARCPVGCRKAATVTESEDGTDVAWTESKQNNLQPDANPHDSSKASKRERAKKANGQTEVLRSNMVDISGHRFGNLVALRPAPPIVYPKGGRQTAFWCLCDCGAEGRYTSCRLREGTSTRCSECYKAEVRVPDEDRKCQWCGVKLSPRSKLPTRCPKHERQVSRVKAAGQSPDGLCGCKRFPYYKLHDCPYEGCPRLRLETYDKGSDLRKEVPA